jgi:hypothetical protein
MRKKTITGLSLLCAMAIVYGLSWFARSQGIPAPFSGFVSHAVGSLILSPVLALVLTRLNRPLLKWRKTRGRDIEEEEKHEIGDSDVISLRLGLSDDVRQK